MNGSFRGFDFGVWEKGGGRLPGFAKSEEGGEGGGVSISGFTRAPVTWPVKSTTKIVALLDGGR